MADSSTITIRQVEPEEFITLGVSSYAFGASPSKPDLERARAGLKYTTRTLLLGVFDDDSPKASTSVHLMTENVRGTVFPMGGFGGVASFPQGRRQGYVRKMLTFGMTLLHERGIPVSTLYPFRDSFYERLGYATMPHNRFAIIRPEHLAPLLKDSLPGEVVQLDMATAFDEWWTFQEHLQATRQGFALFDRSRAVQWQDDNQDWVTLVREDGVVTGAMTFRITGYGKELIADTFQYTTVAARFQLLAWIARHTDQVKQAVIELGPGEYPEMWYRDLNATTTTEHDRAWPPPMGRVVSVAGLDGMAAGADTAVCVTVVDDFCPWNAGIWTLAGEDGVLRVRPGGTPTCHLTIQGLSALVWCGQDPAVFPFRHWGDPGADDQATLQALFPATLPMLNAKF